MMMSIVWDACVQDDGLEIRPTESGSLLYWIEVKPAGGAAGYPGLPAGAVVWKQGSQTRAVKRDRSNCDDARSTE